MPKKHFYEDAESRALWQAAQHTVELRDHLFHIPNGGKRNKREAARMKGMGVRAGVHDYMLPIARGMYHGLWIELKPHKVVLSAKDRPRASDSQITWRNRMRKQGYAAYVIVGWQNALIVMENYLALELGDTLDVAPYSSAGGELV